MTDDQVANFHHQNHYSTKLMKPLLFTEYPEKNELQYYQRLVELVQIQIEKLYGDKDFARRDTHAKTHVAVRGNLEIFDFNEDKIKDQLRRITGLSSDDCQAISLKQGLLATPKVYPVWLRFANGRTSVENDYVPDARSMSVKIMGVEGERLPDSHEQQTQDLITQNSEIFFIKTIKDYSGFFQAVVQSKKSAFFWLITHPRQFFALKKTTSRTPKSLLTEKYWTGSAFSLGLPHNFDPSGAGVEPIIYPAVVKFAFTPVSPKQLKQKIAYQPRPGLPKFPFVKRAKALGLDESQPDNYYRKNIIQELAKPGSEFCWDFGFQLQVSPKMSIDDVTVIWRENKSPFIPVGRLNVKHQFIDFPKQEAFAENLRFSPWNGLSVHRPVGALNRLRRVVYPLVAQYRHQKQAVEYVEPTGDETF